MSRIAIIGSGISGLVCGYKLSPNHDITVFESNDYLGGHTATIDLVHAGKTWAIDTGFIVFNDHTYPHFQSLLDELSVDYQSTEMSFSVTNANNGLIYNGHTLNTLFAQRSNLINPKFWYFLSELLRFNKRCKQLAHTDIDETLTLGTFLTQQGFSDYFAENYILPMVSAIWSSTWEETEQFPLKFFIRFFNNHGLLNIVNRPQWFTICGGSKQYIPALTQNFKDRIQLSTPVTCIKRDSEGVDISIETGTQRFDHVILACHSDQALKLLQDASAAEQAVLGAIPYRDNEVVLHTDQRLLPPLKRAKASWNYYLSDEKQLAASVTYSMNILQRLPADAPEFCVSLNRTRDIDDSKILGTYQYAHPIFNQASLKAQQQRSEICGVERTHFCGAYWYNGFHEDGVCSALDVCQRFESGL